MFSSDVEIFDQSYFAIASEELAATRIQRIRNPFNRPASRTSK
ncbi:MULTISPECIES: hypothetical protein [unclassified Nostoc]|nr:MULTISPECIES: hypothetical protein [unclassified Nostoc]